MVIEVVLYSIVFIVLLVTVFIGGDAGLTVGLFLLICCMAGVLIKFPNFTFALIVILIIALILREIIRSRKKEDGKEASDGGGLGCLISIIGVIIMVPGSFAVFYVLLMNDSVIMTILGTAGCAFLGYQIIKMGD